MSDIGVILVKIWEISKSAVFNLPLIVPVLDIALVVIVFSFVKGIDLSEVISNGSNVIGNYVNHNPDVHIMSSLDEFLERSLITEVTVDLFPVTSPVAVITTIEVVNNWRNPNSVKTEVFNVL